MLTKGCLNCGDVVVATTSSMLLSILCHCLEGLVPGKPIKMFGKQFQKLI